MWRRVVGIAGQGVVCVIGIAGQGVIWVALCHWDCWARRRLVWRRVVGRALREWRCVNGIAGQGGAVPSTDWWAGCGRCVGGPGALNGLFLKAGLVQNRYF